MNSKEILVLMMKAKAKPKEKPKKVKHCARCLNHNMVMRLIGHKRYCPHKDCRCEKCFETTKRQIKMADQIKRHRARQQDAERILQPGEVPPFLEVKIQQEGQVPQPARNIDEGLDNSNGESERSSLRSYGSTSNDSGIFSIPELSKSAIPAPVNLPQFVHKSSLQMLSESDYLMQYFSIPWMAQLGVYIIHKLTNGDVEATKRIIMEGNEEFMGIANIYKFLKNPYWFWHRMLFLPTASEFPSSYLDLSLPSSEPSTKDLVHPPIDEHFSLMKLSP